MKEINPNYNSAYYNFKLLDELDHVIGGYGKASQEFIFNLNSFVESYILNENFFISDQEFQHYFFVSKTLFPNGRPITELLFVKDKKFNILGFPYYINGKIVYVEGVKEKPNQKEESDIIQNFQDKQSDYIINKYSKPSFYEGFNPQYSFLVSQTVENKNRSNSYIIIETTTNPKDLLQSIYKTMPNSNFQTTLPLNALKQEIISNKSQSISSKSIKILSDLHNTKIEELVKYTGYNHIKLPPLVPILLSQCNTISDIPTKLKQLREDFTELRNSFIKFEKALDDADTIKKQIEIIDYYKLFWESFHKKYKMKTNRLLYHFWDIESKSGLSDSTENVLDSNTTEDLLKDLNITKIAGSITSKLYSWHKERKAMNRFKGMTNIWDLFQNSPTLENQVRDIERLFNLKINPEELSKIANQLIK